MRFGILGPLEISSEDGRPVATGGMRVGMPLAVLHRPPRRARPRRPADRRALAAPSRRMTPAARCRPQRRGCARPLGPDRVVSRAGGYAVLVRPGELDADRFELLGAGGEAASGRGRLRRPPRRGWPRRWRSGAGRPRRLRLRGVRAGRDRATRGAPARRARGAARGGSRRSAAHGRARRGARGARRATHPLRERLARAAHARALPLGPAGGRARGVPRQPARTLVDELGIEPGAGAPGARARRSSRTTRRSTWRLTPQRPRDRAKDGVRNGRPCSSSRTISHAWEISSPWPGLWRAGPAGRSWSRRSSRKTPISRAPCACWTRGAPSCSRAASLSGPWRSPPRSGTRTRFAWRRNSVPR